MAVGWACLPTTRLVLCTSVRFFVSGGSAAQEIVQHILGLVVDTMAVRR